MNISIDLKGLEKLDALPGQIEKAAQQALGVGGNLLVRQYSQEVEKTYGRAIPKRITGKQAKRFAKKKDIYDNLVKKGGSPELTGPKGSGKPLWTRSGDLQRGITKEVTQDTVTVSITGNAAAPITNYEGGYAEKLTTLPVSKDGVNRKNDFPANAAKVVKPQLQRVIESEIKNALGI